MNVHVCCGDVVPAVRITLVGHVADRPVRGLIAVAILMIPANPAPFAGRLETVKVVELVPPEMNVIG